MTQKELLRWSVASLLMVLLIDFSLVVYADSMIATFLAADPFHLQAVSEVLTGFGDAIVYFVLAIAGTVICYTRRKNPAWRLWYFRFLFALTGLLSAGLMVRILKFMIGRQRPHISPAHDAMVFDPFNTHWHYHSFPSGHAQVCFTVATILSLLHPKGTWFYVLLALTMTLTRPLIGVHFISDIVTGAWVGVIGVLWAAMLWDQKFWFQRPGLQKIRINS